MGCIARNNVFYATTQTTVTAGVVTTVLNGNSWYNSLCTSFSATTGLCLTQNSAYYSGYTAAGSIGCTIGGTNYNSGQSLQNFGYVLGKAALNPSICTTCAANTYLSSGSCAACMANSASAVGSSICYCNPGYSQIVTGNILISCTPCAASFYQVSNTASTITN